MLFMMLYVFAYTQWLSYTCNEGYFTHCAVGKRPSSTPCTCSRDLHPVLVPWQVYLQAVIHTSDGREADICMCYMHMLMFYRPI